MRRHARAWVLQAVGAAVSRRLGLRVINAVHRRMSPRSRQRLFHLTHDQSWRVAGDWHVEFAGRHLVLPLHREFPLAWMAAVAFHGYDPELHELYASLVRSTRPPRVFFDIGASYGLHSLRLLAHGVRVVSFEPNPECHDFFLDCCRANGLLPEIVPAAVGAARGWATLTVPADRTYLGSIVPDLGPRWGPSVSRLEVPLTSLDDFAAERGLVPDLVKIDVEGGELDVLHGARSLLAEARPMVIFESWAGSGERRRLYDLFAGHGYTVHEPTADPREAALPCRQFLASPGTNFVACPPHRRDASASAAAGGVTAHG